MKHTNWADTAMKFACSIRRLSNSHAREIRRQSGGVLVEGTVAIILIIGVVVGGLMLLINGGMAAYYKEKLALSSGMAANFAASDTGNSQQADTQAYVASLLANMGVHASSVTINGIQTITLPGGQLGNQQATQVALTASGLPLVANYFGSISLQDTGVSNPLIYGYCVAEYPNIVSGKGIMIPVLQQPFGPYCGSFIGSGSAQNGVATIAICVGAASATGGPAVGAGGAVSSPVTDIAPTNATPPTCNAY